MIWPGFWSVEVSAPPFWKVKTLRSRWLWELSFAVRIATSRSALAPMVLNDALRVVLRLSFSDSSVPVIWKMAKYSPPLWIPATKTSPNRSRNRSGFWF